MSEPTQKPIRLPPALVSILTNCRKTHDVTAVLFKENRICFVPLSATVLFLYVLDRTFVMHVSIAILISLVFDKTNHNVIDTEEL